MNILTIAYKSITVLTIGIGLLMVTTTTFAQGVGFGEADFTPNDKAILELNATTKGFLQPRMTEAARIAITGLGADEIGLTVYQTDGMAGRYVWTGSAWTVMNATPIGAIQGFMTIQDPLLTGWAPMSPNSTVEEAKFPAFAALVNEVKATNNSSELGIINAGTITITDLNTDKRFIRGGAVAGIAQDQGTAPNGLKNVDVYLSSLRRFGSGSLNGKKFTIKRDDVIKNGSFTAKTGGEIEDDPISFTQDIHKFVPSGGGNETRPINYSIIWHVYVGLPVN